MRYLRKTVEVENEEHSHNTRTKAKTMKQVHLVLGKLLEGNTQILRVFDNLERAYDTARKYKTLKVYDNVNVQSVTLEKGETPLRWRNNKEDEEATNDKQQKR